MIRSVNALLHHAITGPIIPCFDPVQFVQVALILNVLVNVLVEFWIDMEDPISNKSHHVLHFHRIAMLLMLARPEQVDMYIDDVVYSSNASNAAGNLLSAT